MSTESPVAEKAQPGQTTSLSPATVGWLAFSTMFVIGTDTFLVAPMLPTLAAAFTVTADASGWMISAYALGFAVFALIAGPLSDGRDRRGVLLAGFAGFIVTTALCGLAQNFWMMIAFRLLTGMCAALVTPQIWASIPSLVTPSNVMRTMGFAGAGMSISQVVGVPIGGWLAVSSWHVPFFAVSGVAAIAWVFLWRLFPPVPAAAGSAGFLGTYGAIFRSRTLGWYLLAYLLYQTGVFTTFSFIGSWFAEDFGLGVGAISTSMAALGTGMAITSLFGGRRITKLGQRRTLHGVFAALIALYGAAPFSPNVGVAIACFAAGSAVLGLAYPLFMALLLEQTSAARGTVSSLSTSALYAGTTIAGAVGGVLLGRFTGFFGVAAFTVVALLVSLGVFATAGAFRPPSREPR